MNYLEALRLAHETIKPHLYVEIGCRVGISLALARCRAIAVDPDFEITQTLSAPTSLYRETSDDFFARGDLAEILGEGPDLAFIDGMHRVEYALRDFMNLESSAKPSSVILTDDVLPADMSWATRDREGQYWTGDVYRLIRVLREYRPDLTIEVFDIEIKGLAIISGLDPQSTVLKDAYGEIVERLEAGEWREASLDSLRDRLAPVPASRVRDHLESVAARRSGPGQGEPGAAGRQNGRYLDLLKKILLNEIYIEDELRISYLRQCLDGTREFSYADLHDIGKACPQGLAELQRSRAVGQFPGRKVANCGFNHTMMGRARLDSLHAHLDLVCETGVEGDLMECGVWRGGACIFMQAYLKARGLTDRRVFVADSFEGLPAPSEQDRGLDLTKARYPQLAVDQETVRRNFELYDLLDDNVVFLKGWFADTLPTAPVDRIALLRLDGDLYSSTMDALNALYDKVSSGGVVIMDDYGAIEVCRNAVGDFFASRGEELPEMVAIDGSGVYWLKPLRVEGACPGET
ncbi:TylF/MycF/NovP-related O-methyltransferase [Breoghania sp.]|uniref:TylF/MycF/NovP-related O-methyltransferase n=1 Tax=Breoghania sp. TaxID=2065378 RepID=UPI0029C9ECFC|nr:TylF/MycF/NovP-related O-methyltransferase [Breoghania sp.]